VDVDLVLLLLEVMVVQVEVEDMELPVLRVVEILLLKFQLKEQMEDLLMLQMEQVQVEVVRL
tara:strand:- start:200 stop:385 length:186 start_codon:yes stop_codon:yes gene_type:complete